MIKIKITDDNDDILYEKSDDIQNERLSNYDIRQIAKALPVANNVYIKYDSNNTLYTNHIYVSQPSDYLFGEVIQAIDDMYNLRTTVSQDSSLASDADKSLGLSDTDNRLVSRSRDSESDKISRSRDSESDKISRSRDSEVDENSCARDSESDEVSCSHDTELNKTSCLSNSEYDKLYDIANKNRTRELMQKLIHNKDSYKTPYELWYHKDEQPPQKYGHYEHTKQTPTQQCEKSQTNMEKAEAGPCKEQTLSYTTNETIADFIGYLRTQESWATLIDKLRFYNNPNDPTGKAELITEFREYMKKTKTKNTEKNATKNNNVYTGED